FSSRRRHTRFSRDWSSDVCSSDLPQAQEEMAQTAEQVGEEVTTAGAAASFWAFLALLLGAIAAALAGRQGSSSGLKDVTGGDRQIGRASCRNEGTCQTRQYTTVQS